MMTANDARLIIEAMFVTVAFVVFVGAASWYVVQSRRRPPPPPPNAVAVAELSAANDEMARQIRSLQREQMTMHADLIRLQARLEIQNEYSHKLADYSRMLADRLRALGEVDIPPPPAAPPEAPPPVAPVTEEVAGQSLPVILASLFNNEELDNLAAEIGALPEDLIGETVSRRATSLVLWARRRGRLDRLVAVARRLRPDGGI